MQTQPSFKFTSRIASPNCTVTVTKREKSCATIFKEQCKSTSVNGHFIRGTLNPLSKQGFCDSLKSRRRLRGLPQDRHVMAAIRPARHPAKFLALNPNHVPAMAGQWQRQRLCVSVETTRKTICFGQEVGARCQRRKLARRLATRSRNSRAAGRVMSSATSRKTTRSNLNHDTQKL
jgi:hypothetical protein